MRLVEKVLFALLLGGLVLWRAGAAGALNGKPLVVIDEQAYSVADYEHWWEYWRDSESQQPESVEPFVDWSLLVREAERMELFTVPEFKHKVQVFLKTRALMALKHEEIDSKAQVSDEEVLAAYGSTGTAAAPADAAKKKEELRRVLAKKKEDALTDRLVAALRQKYQVRVDQQVLNGIDLAAPEANDPQKIVIGSDRSTVTVGYFLEQYRKQAEVARQPLGSPEAQLALKSQIANTMIANSLVEWEALARQYEERAPLRWAYQFYRQNRLLVELENRALGDLQTTDSEALAYYHGHADEFRRDEVVRLLVVNGEERAVKRVWAEALTGADLVTAAKENAVPVVRDAALEVATPQLSGPLREVLGTLKPGGLSQPFLDNGQSALLKLVDRKPGGLADFAGVEKAIKAKLMREKKAKRKQALLDTLRSRSAITVADEVWSAVQQQYRQVK